MLHIQPVIFAILISLPFSLVYGNQEAKNADYEYNHANRCDSTQTITCLLHEILQQVKNIQPSSEKESLLAELGVEAYLFAEQDIFKRTMLELANTNPKTSISLTSALQKLSPKLSKTSPISATTLASHFPTKSSKNIAKEEVLLHSIRNQHYASKNSETRFEGDIDDTPLHDSLELLASQVYYWTLIREVELKKSIALKRSLIKKMVRLPKEQQDQYNLSLSLMETLGGALKQGKETQQKSNINGFSNHGLSYLNQRISFYQKFIKFYNTRIGLNQDQCSEPKSTINNTLDIFFSDTNKTLISELERITSTNPNDYLISGSILRKLNNCSPISLILFQRYLDTIHNIKYTKEKIYFLRSYRRYSTF
ncbi:MAG: hypothetical protein COA99_03725 [Moraxellaceae bacterium]|nr:MAG: hypothetical protein COA99_03725 [Moraxellaceae bacterium]